MPLTLEEANAELAVLHTPEQPVHGHRTAFEAERGAPVESLVVQRLRVYPRRGL